jgi:glutathione S-transferase
MSKLTLLIGNKNYSSWSLRPWLVLKYFVIPFEEVLVPLYEGNFKEKILEYAPSGKVPTLIHGDVVVWESLAIGEYLADIFPQKNLWPKEPGDRALARAISHEMHAGFANLRTQMPMNVRKKLPGLGRTPDVDKDIRRIREIWGTCRSKFAAKGDFLFGSFSIADAMYAPVVYRFNTYEVPLSGLEKTYFETMLSLPVMTEWAQAAIEEPYEIAYVEEKYGAFTPKK